MPCNIQADTLNCIAWEPFNNPNYRSNPRDAVYSDLDRIKKQGFKCIKTYYSSFYGQLPAEAALDLGLKIVLGIRMEEANLVDAELQAAITSCRTKRDAILAIYAGNENMQPLNREQGAPVAQKIMDLYGQVKASGCTAPFGTVQTIGYWLRPRAQMHWDWFQALDWHGYNVYPFFSDLGGGRKSPMDSLQDQINQLSNAYGDVFGSFILTETGWPTAGNASPQGNWPSPGTAMQYANDFAAKMCSDQIRTPWVSYFIYNDPEWKRSFAPEFELHFGVATAQGEPKFNLGPLARCA